MHKELNATVNKPLDSVWPVVSDLATFPQWIEIVDTVVVDAGEPPAHFVILKARLGPISRSKKLRMVQTARGGESDPEANNSVTFERQETHDIEVAMWKMNVTACSTGESSTQLSISLSYDGELWLPAFGAILDSQVPKTIESLERYIQESK